MERGPGRAEAAARRLGEWLAGLDATRYASVTLINNAGVIPQIAPLSQLRPADIAQAMRVGLEAPMLLTAAFLAATEGWTAVPRKVLNISSGLGRRAIASQASYCAAKAGMDHFSRSVALDEALKPHGARICSLAPGVIDTDMQVQLRSADAAAFPTQATSPSSRRAASCPRPSRPPPWCWAGCSARILASRSWPTCASPERTGLAGPMQQ